MKKVMVNTKDNLDPIDFWHEAIVEDDGAIKWESNGRYLMDDTMLNIIANGFSDFNINATRTKRAKETAKFFAEYRKQQRTPSQEELAEMRNEFGVGSTVVDVISGQEIKL